MTDQDFNRFYDEEYLGDVLKWEQRFTDLALRYKSINAGDKFPYLALYPVHDCSFFTLGEHQRMANATRKVRFLDGLDILDYVEYEPHQYRRVQTFEGQELTERKARGRARTLICVVIEPAEDDHEEFDEWYRKQHLDMLSMCPGFRRSTRYQRLDQVKPSYLVLHEYDCEPTETPADHISKTVNTAWSKKLLSRIHTYERTIYELIQEQGDVSKDL